MAAKNKILRLKGPKIWICNLTSLMFVLIQAYKYSTLLLAFKTWIEFF